MIKICNVEEGFKKIKHHINVSVANSYMKTIRDNRDRAKIVVNYSHPYPQHITNDD